MTGHVGIWVDHSSARLVGLPAGPEEAPRYASIGAEVESQHRAFGGKGETAPGHRGGGGAESHYRRRRAGQLARYFEAIADELRQADAVAVLGPDGARLELLQHLRDHPEPRTNVVAAARSGRLTDHELAVRTRSAIDHALGTRS